MLAETVDVLNQVCLVAVETEDRNAGVPRFSATLRVR